MKILKKLSVVALATGIVLSTITTSAVTGTNQNSKFTLNSKTWTLNGQTKTMDASPQMLNNRVYLPIRYAAVALGIDESNIKYANKTVTITDNGQVVTLKEGSNVLTVNGNAINMDGKVVSLKGRVYLPLSQVARVFNGVNLKWDAQSKSVTISRDNEISSTPETTEKTDLEDVITAYEKFYNGKKSEYFGKVTFNLAYIDNDDIPELIIRTDAVRPEPQEIYRYVDGKVVYVGTIDDFGEYAPKTGYVCDTSEYLQNINGGGVTVYKLEGTKLTKIATGKYTPNKTKYTWQGKVVTKTQYDKSYKQAAKRGEYTYTELASSSTSIREAYKKLQK